MSVRVIDHKSVVWKNRETGEYLKVDTKRTHTKLNDSYMMTDDIHQATPLYTLPRGMKHIKREDLSPVTLIVTGEITIKEQN